MAPAASVPKSVPQATANTCAHTNGPILHWPRGRARTRNGLIEWGRPGGARTPRRQVAAICVVRVCVFMTPTRPS